MMRRGWAAEAFVLFAGLVAGACTRHAPTDSAPAPAPLAIEMSGCAIVTSRAECLVGAERTARIFVGSKAAATFTSAEGTVEAETLATRDDGRLYKVRVPAGVRGVRVTVSEGARAETLVKMGLDTPPQWLLDLRARGDKGDPDGTLRGYLEHRASTDVGEAALAAGQAARIELARGRIPESVALFREAIDADRRAGRLSAAVDDSFALAYTLNERGHRTAEARSAIDAVADLLPQYPDGRAREPYYRGTIASEARDRRLALTLYREAERRASRLGIPRLVQSVRMALAASLAELGRFEEALDILHSVVRDFGAEGTPCDHVSAWSGMGFDLLMLATRERNDGGSGGGDRIAQAIEALERGRAEVACADGYLHATTLAHLALASLLSGRADDAAASLAAARARSPDHPLSQSFFWLDLEGRIALARHDPARALEAYDELEKRARAALLPEYEWSALVGRGTTLEALGRREGALGAYARAEEKLDDASLTIPIGEGRAGFLVERERSSTAAIALLVANKKNEEALRWARRARRRVLSGLEGARRLERLGATERARWDAAIDRYARERASIDEEAARDWKLPVAELGPAQERRRAREAALRSALEELLSVVAGEGMPAVHAPPPIPDGEAILVFHPAANGWTGMIADRTNVAVFRVAAFDPKSSPAELARLLLAPAHTEIDRASRLRLLLPGALAQIDFHALPYGDGPLVARLPVEYGLDLGELDAPAAIPPPPRALVVADPQRNLPEARREGHAVEGALRASPGSVDLLEADAATHAAVLSALGGASLFHYAGHATYEGEDGWDSTLPLAAGGKLLVSDVLALRAVPSHVVLSGCSAARTASASPGDTLGIAQAFLVAGSDEVVAPTRDVDDALSARFVARLYEGLRGGGADLATAARAAQLHLREVDPASDWANFRVLRR